MGNTFVERQRQETARQQQQTLQNERAAQERRAREHKDRESQAAAAKIAQDRRQADIRAQTERTAASERFQAQRIADERRQQDRIAQEAATKRASVPSSMESRAGQRMPAYESPQSLARKGYSPDTISTVNPKSTPISYYEANKRNEEGRAKYGPGYIPEYQKDSYITKGTSNPNGSGPLAHVHRDRDVPASSPWTTSQDAMRKNYGGQEPAKFVRQTLDLPKAPSYVSEAKLKSGSFTVEISHTHSGGEQIYAPVNQTSYSRTSPIGSLKKWLGI